ALPGTATALGGWRSKPASYSQTRRSSARQKTLSSPQISWSRRTSADGEVAVTVGVTRGGTASPGGAGERVAREPRALGPASPGEVTTRSASSLRVLLDPHRAVLRVLFLPDRHDGLELVDRRARRGERRIAGRGGGRHHDRDVPDAEIADAMMHRDAERTVLPGEAVGDLPHLGLGHLGVRLVLDPQDALPAAAAAHRAEEDDDASERVVAHERERVVGRERLFAYGDGLERPGIST